MKNTCNGCKYFDACGDPDRTAPCKGRSVARKKKYYHMIVEPIGNWPGETTGRKVFIKLIAKKGNRW